MNALRALFRVLPFTAGLGVLACVSDDRVAGGSSEVDNPQVLVAFTDNAGGVTAFTGSLSLFLADQNPASDPDPLLKKLVTADSVLTLTGSDFKADSLRAYNLLLITEDSSGAILRGLSYDPRAGAFRVADTSVSRVSMRPVPLVRYEGRLELSAEGLVRVIVPGTPFQAVVVDSVFRFDGVPSGDSLSLHLLDLDGQEKPLKPDPPVGPGDKPRHRVDSAAPPVHRPPPPDPQGGKLRVNAGPDRSLVAGAEFVLFGEVEGAGPKDQRLAVLWRQIHPNPNMARATIESPSSLQTRVAFPWPGIYGFVLSAAFGNHRDEDTVWVGAQPPSVVFYDPNPFNPASAALYIGTPFPVRWDAYVQDYVPDTLDLELSRDSGVTWSMLFEDVPSFRFTERLWTPTGPPSPNCFLRLRDRDEVVVAVSARFPLRSGPPPPQN